MSTEYQGDEHGVPGVLAEYQAVEHGQNNVSRCRHKFLVKAHVLFIEGCGHEDDLRLGVLLQDRLI